MTYETALSALADPTRRAIFEDVRRRPAGASALASARPISRPAVSQHLKVLLDAGLVEVEPKGAARVYRVRPEGLAPLRAWLDTYWDDALAAFAAEVANREERDGADPQDDRGALHAD
jgi:DNA-binding transcriptional ArsR family regulator